MAIFYILISMLPIFLNSEILVNKTKICSSVFPLKLKDNKQAQTNSLLESTNTLFFVFHIIEKQPQKELAINSTSKQKRH